jgi:endonuclease YncB( thermonuclease family)
MTPHRSPDLSRFGSTLIAAISLLALAACSQPHSLYADGPAPSAEPTSQISVVQADALIVDGRRVHLVDAVTPQPAPDARCAAEALASRQARLRMSALAAQVRHVEVKLTGTLDGYNRANAHLTFDGVDPAQVLIDEGLAVAPQQQAFSWCGPLSESFPQASRVAMLSLTGS